jgi:hypothetical protein
MLKAQAGKLILSFGLEVGGMQNGFVSKGWSHDKLEMKVKFYQRLTIN